MIDQTQAIKDIMSTHLITVNENDVIQQVAEIFNQHDIHHIPVVNDYNKLVGMISLAEYNVMLHSYSLFNDVRSRWLNTATDRTILAKEVMRKSIVMLHPNDPISLAAGIFRENLFHALAIVDEDEQLVGLLSTYDLINHAYPVTISSNSS